MVITLTLGPSSLFVPSEAFQSTCSEDVPQECGNVPYLIVTTAANHTPAQLQPSAGTLLATAITIGAKR